CDAQRCVFPRADIACIDFQLLTAAREAIEPVLSLDTLFQQRDFRTSFLNRMVQVGNLFGVAGVLVLSIRRVERSLHLIKVVLSLFELLALFLEQLSRAL